MLPESVKTFANTCPVSNLQQGQVHSFAVLHLHTQHFWRRHISEFDGVFSIRKQEALMLAKSSLEYVAIYSE